MKRSRTVQVLIAVNTYVRALLIPPSMLGLWFPKDGKVHLHGLDPDHLAGFSWSELPDGFAASRELSYYAIGRREFELSLDLRMPEGTHRIDLPAGLDTLDEIIIVGGWLPGTEQGFSVPEEEMPADVVLLLEPRNRPVQVLPQKWFTAKQFDLAISGSHESRVLPSQVG